MKTLILFLAITIPQVVISQDMNFLDFYAEGIQEASFENADIVSMYAQEGLKTSDIIRGDVCDHAPNCIVVDRNGAIIWINRSMEDDLVIYYLCGDSCNATVSQEEALGSLIRVLEEKGVYVTKI